jgi:hypothetical protein
LDRRFNDERWFVGAARAKMMQYFILKNLKILMPRLNASSNQKKHVQASAVIILNEIMYKVEIATWLV